jgi:hypothetical protein
VKIKIKTRKNTESTEKYNFFAQISIFSYKSTIFRQFFKHYENNSKDGSVQAEQN